MDGVTVNAEWTRCESVENGTSKEYVILSLANQNGHPIKLSFKKEIWYNGICLSCNSESLEYVFATQLDAQGAMKGSCEVNNGLRIFAKMTDLKNVRQLSHYELKQISVHEVD